MIHQKLDLEKAMNQPYFNISSYVTLFKKQWKRILLNVIDHSESF